MKDRTILITGASRGIGREFALRFAREGANLILLSKTFDRPHLKLKGTLLEVAEEVEALGAHCLPMACDVREEKQIEEAVARGAEKFGGIDAVINNAGAIQLTGTADTAARRVDLMLGVNFRATFLCVQKALRYLKASKDSHILSLSPPIDLDPKWIAGHLPYTLSKYGMSMASIGWAKEFEADGIRATSLWPRTVIATAAIDMLMGEKGRQVSRTPAIMADAAFHILTAKDDRWNGRCVLDEEVLKDAGITDLSGYSEGAEADLEDDLFVGKAWQERG